MNVEKFHERLKKCRKEKGLTQAKLAENANMGVATIIRYEKGERVPNLEAIKKIADALEMTTEELLYNVSLPAPDSIMTAFDHYTKGINNDTDKLLENYNKLNTSGKQEAVKRVEELTEIPKYTTPDEE